MDQLEAIAAGFGVFWMSFSVDLCFDILEAIWRVCFE